MQFFPEKNQTILQQPLFSNRSMQLSSVPKRSQSFGKIRKNRPKIIGDLLDQREKINNNQKDNFNQYYEINKLAFKKQFNLNKKLASKLLQLSSRTNDINIGPLKELPVSMPDKLKMKDTTKEDIKQNSKRIKKRNLSQIPIINTNQKTINIEENIANIDIKQNVLLETPKFTNIPINKILVQSLRPEKYVFGKGREQFISAIIKQIHLEQNLRRLKHNVKLDSKEILKQILQQSYKMDSKMLNLDYEEYDPMFDPQNIKSVKILARQIQIASYQAESHWKQRIYQQFQTTFAADVFERLNVNAYNGVISLSLFARGLNRMIQNDSFIASRDVYRIYNRIQPFNKQKFLETLTVKNLKTFIR